MKKLTDVFLCKQFGGFQTISRRMVQVKWRKAALKDLNTLLEKAYLEYGQHTMNNHISILEDIQKRMQMYPDSYPPEPLLRGKRRRYRGAHLLGRFEVIYYYSLKSKCVYVVRLWDMRRNPDLLLRELK